MSGGEPVQLYVLDEDERCRARVWDYLAWLEAERGLRLEDWDGLWRWSVGDLEGFWASIADYFGVRYHAPYERVLADRRMPGSVWFPGALLNYAEHCLGQDADRVAVVAHSQTRERVELTFGELAEQVARARTGLRALGVGRGDRVVAYLPNIPETLVAFLATASLGAVWASCAPEFGAHSVIERFGQVTPKVLLAVAGYTYGAKEIDRREEVAEIVEALPSLEHVVHVPYGPLDIPGALSWDDVTAGEPEPPAFEPVPFDHPLYVLFSSGTTGRPKAIMHGHGGILLEHLKNHALHWDLGPGDRLLWFTTTAWMMWNTLVSSLLVGASVVMIDGNPLYPDLRHQWRLAERTRATLMGVSPGFLMACRKEGVRPAAEFDLSALRQLGAAGSPLPAEGFRWVYEQFGDRVLLNVGSGGTDVCTGIVQGSPVQPVWLGEMSGCSLGVDAKAFDHRGEAVVGELGELVITAPMPSMPVGFWGDDDGSRYRSAYFDDFPGVWRHGDWIGFSEQGTCVITGRSDATLNRGGVRLGTAEFYRVVEEIDEVRDSLVVHLEDPAGGMGELMLFVVPREGVVFDEPVRRALEARIRKALSPRHVPDVIHAVPALPYNRTGKKLEVPVKRILRGDPVETVATPGSLADPSSLDAFVDLAHRREEARG
ncbi:acetoacetate--CoA ligase [Nonomuraea turkmeniaca]|uniref:Acetoacetate--CoA ligase n=1 Tax=Nonomuraea turkmeniaca TaxID=103838 RepID=A0A5S4FW94_9ACTN|nr:acetoacetate--CoA ligase [Nonomuraea turkmeniaca]TMR24933.1 acetoacetate--CoA ligase [Nonomuraea turkmeniaca]